MAVGVHTVHRALAAHEISARAHVGVPVAESLFTQRACQRVVIVYPIVAILTLASVLLTLRTESAADVPGTKVTPASVALIRAAITDVCAAIFTAERIVCFVVAVWASVYVSRRVIVSTPMPRLGDFHDSGEHLDKKTCVHKIPDLQIRHVGDAHISTLG
mgnify:CR=1 FL=1